MYRMGLTVRHSAYARRTTPQRMSVRAASSATARSSPMVMVPHRMAVTSGPKSASSSSWCESGRPAPQTEGPVADVVT